MVHLADILVRSEGYGSGGDRRIPVAFEEAISLLNLRERDFLEIMDVTVEAMRGVIT